jgi:hypothetical protein
MFTVTEVLLTVGVKFPAYPKWAAGNVYITDANQLTFKNLGQFRNGTAITRAGTDTMSSNAPPYDDQLCVLHPEGAHVGRINSILRRESPPKWHASGQELRRAYADAYALMGDYCGAGEAKIRRKLMAIVNAEFQKLGVP